MNIAHRKSKLGSALAAIGLQALLGYAFILGLTVHGAVGRNAELKLFDIAPPKLPAPPRVVPPKPRSHRPEGASSPPNLRARAIDVVAPRPEVRLPPPPQIAAAPVAGTGSAPSAGASDMPGPGTGSGGLGNGTGGGGYGDGDGGGGDGIPPRRIKGRLRNSDYPRSAGEMGAGGTVSVRYTVNTDGRVSNCSVTMSSGNAAIDETTCRLIEQRFRFDPSRDEDGRAVRSIIVENHSWIIEQLPPEPRQEVKVKRRFPF